jgi:hypothetical protein
MLNGRERVFPLLPWYSQLTSLLFSICLGYSDAGNGLLLFIMIYAEQSYASIFFLSFSAVIVMLSLDKK